MQHKKETIKYNKLDNLKQFELIRICKNHQERFFKPHRHDFYEVIYITDGYGKHMIDFQTYELEPNTIHLIRPSQIHQWEDVFNSEYDGYIFLFSKDLLQLNKILDNLFHFHTTSIVNLNEPVKTYVDNLISMIEYDSNNHQNRIVPFAFSIILEYIIMLRKENSTNSLQDTRIALLLELIENNFIDEKSALFYAKSFDLTTKRLNELTKLHLNKTTSSLIIDRNIIEAKRELMYSDSSIVDLSQQLGFQDAPQFIKYFKRYTSCTPLEFKKLTKLSNVQI